MNDFKKTLSTFISIQIDSDEWLKRKPVPYIDKMDVVKHFDDFEGQMLQTVMRRYDICDNRYYILIFEEDNITQDQLDELEVEYSKKFIEDIDKLDKNGLPVVDKYREIYKTLKEILNRKSKLNFISTPSGIKPIVKNLTPEIQKIKIKTASDIMKKIIDTGDTSLMNNLNKYQRRYCKDALKHKNRQQITQ